MYEYRQLDNPAAMPLGNATISTHRTLAAAQRACARERAAFAASAYSTGGGYLQRVIVMVLDGDDAGACPEHAYEDSD